MSLDLGTFGHEVWQLQGADPERPYVLPIVRDAGGGGDLGTQRAYWVAADTILWAAADDPSATYRLHHSPTGGLALTDSGVSGDSIVLTRRRRRPGRVRASSPTSPAPGAEGHAGRRRRGARAAARAGRRRGRRAPAARGVDATGLQIPGVLDDLFAYDGDLGVTWDGATPTLRVWAPTARRRRAAAVRRRRPGDRADHGGDEPATPPPASGRSPASRRGAGRFYRYDVEVYVPSLDAVDPQRRHRPVLAVARHRLAALADRRPRRPGAGARRLGRTSRSRRCRRRRTSSIYELHVRDFSAGDPTVPEAAARHVRRVHGRGLGRDAAPGALADAGLGAVHLLPVFDIATIAEDRSTWQQPDPAVLATYPPDSDEQQAAVERDPGRSTASTGATTRGTTPRRRAATPPIPRARRGSSSSATWSQPLNGDRPARRDGRGLQPHDGRRPGPEVGARPRRARVLPPPRRHRRDHDVDVLRQHRHRAPHDGEADHRLRRHVGPRRTRSTGSAST